MSTLLEITFRYICIEGEDDGLEVSVNARMTEETTEINVISENGQPWELMPRDFERAAEHAREIWKLTPTPEAEPNPLQKEHWENEN